MMHNERMVSRGLAGLLAALLVALVTAGCGSSGPELGQVEGTVTLDGKPLPNASVEFLPDGQRGSGGMTDETGKYQLSFLRDQTGAVLGKHKVQISTLSEGGDPERGDPPDSPELVPAKYNTETTLEATVESGDNTLDFDLTSE